MTTPAAKKGDTGKKVAVAEPWTVQAAVVEEGRLEDHHQPQEQQQPEHEQGPAKRPRRQYKLTFKLQASRDDASNEVVGGAKSSATAAEAPREAKKNGGCTKSARKVDRRKSKPSAGTNAARVDSKRNHKRKREWTFSASRTEEEGSSSCGGRQPASTTATAATTSITSSPPLAPTASSAESIKPPARRSTKSKAVRDEARTRGPVGKKKVVAKEITRRGQRTGGARKKPSPDEKKKSRPVDQRKENKAPSNVGAPPATQPSTRKTPPSASADNVGLRPRKGRASLPTKAKGDDGVVGAAGEEARAKRVRFSLEGIVAVGTCARGETGKGVEDWAMRLLAAGLSVGDGEIRLAAAGLPEARPRTVRDDELGGEAGVKRCGRTAKRSRAERAGASSMPVASDRVPAGKETNCSASAAAIVGLSGVMHGPNAIGVTDEASETAADLSPQKDEGVVAERMGKDRLQQRVETRRSRGGGAGASAAARAKAAALMGFMRLSDLG